VRARCAGFLGWVGMSVGADVLLARALQGHPSAAVVFRYRTAASKAVFRTGSAPRGGQSVTIDLGQFSLVYQPIYDLEDLDLVGVEALIRWQQPTPGEIQPDRFIPLLEASGQMVEVGRWVLIEACTRVAARREQGLDLIVSVNVSGRQLDRDAVVEHVREALETSGLDAAASTIEVTETALIRNLDASTRHLQELKELGVQVAIDDFGTGYSTLAYLQRFPIDCLKIDRSFTDAVLSYRCVCVASTSCGGRRSTGASPSRLAVARGSRAGRFFTPQPGCARRFLPPLSAVVRGAAMPAGFLPVGVPARPGLPKQCDPPGLVSSFEMARSGRGGVAAAGHGGTVAPVLSPRSRAHRPARWGAPARPGSQWLEL
jgi:EAL domain-containing protein (putative c-di-GMP-specific phosphodiesterase class I)